MFELENYLNKKIFFSSSNLNQDEIETNKEIIKKLSNKERPIKNYLQYEYIINNHSKNDHILDFGCGNGVLVMLLYLKGYKNIKCVDVIKNKKRDRIFKIINFNNSNFKLIDKKLPFEDCNFDLVISNTVIEHVKDVDKYFYETSRVLKKNKKAFFIFPHRLKPYDTHTRTFIIHYFPKIIRKYLYNIFTKEGGNHYNDFLNLKFPYFYNKLSTKYFSKVNNISKKRLLKYDLNSYDGNKKIRKFYMKLILIPFVGKILLYLTSIFSQLSLILTK